MLITLTKDKIILFVDLANTLALIVKQQLKTVYHARQQVSEKVALTATVKINTMKPIANVLLVFTLVIPVNQQQILVKHVQLYLIGPV